MELARFACVAGPGDAAGVRVLRDGLARHHPGTPLTVATLTGARAPLEAVTGIEVVGMGELARGAHRSPVHLPAATLRRLARPLLLQRLLADGAPAAVLLPADGEVRGRLTALEAALDGHDVVAPRRSDGPLPDDGERPDANDLRLAGEVDDEVVAARAGAPAARMLGQWLDLVVRGTGLEAGQAPPSALSPKADEHAAVTPLVDAGYGLSAWNLHARPLRRDGAGLVRAAGRPVCLLRWTGFRPDRPWWLSDVASRVRVLDDPVLAALCRERAAALVAAGWTPPGRTSPAAPPSDERVHRLVLEAHDAGQELGDLERPSGRAALRAWLSGPAAAGAAVGVNRYTYDVWCVREDVRRAFPDLDGADGPGFVAWLWAHGRREAALDESLLPALG